MAKAPKKRAQPPLRRGEPRQAAMALRDEIKAWVEGGGTLAKFFDDHRITGSYSQFVRNVNAHILNTRKENTHARSEDRSTQPGSKEPATSPRPAEGHRGFHYSPSQDADKDNLI